MNSMRSAIPKHRKLLFFIIFILINFVFVTLYHSSILIFVGEYLITEKPLERADAIVVLSGTGYDRILEAVDTYKQGYAPLIILTKDEKNPGYDELLRLGIKIPEGYDLNRMVALKLGVPASSLIIIDERVYGTYSEIKVLYDFLKKRNLKSVILITSKYHTTRATKIFDHITAGEIKVVTRPSKYDTFDPKNWWKVRADRIQTILEYQELAHYYLLTLIPML